MKEIQKPTQFNISFNISRKAKHVSIRIKRDAIDGGICVVVVPFRKTALFQNILLQKANRFAESKKEWISHHIEKYKKLQEKINERRGEGREKGWREGAGDPGSDRHTSTSETPRKKISDTELKARTLQIVQDRLVYFNTFYNFSYKDVRVKKVSTRWGSCSRKGNLNFSHKLGLMRPEEIDYVVVHELCHLREFNHGQNFWKLVEQTIPDYARIRKGMRGVDF